MTMDGMNGDWAAAAAMVLGHEAAGVVFERAGRQTRKKGDHVISRFARIAALSYCSKAARAVLRPQRNTRLAQHDGTSGEAQRQRAKDGAHRPLIGVPGLNRGRSSRGKDCRGRIRNHRMQRPTGVGRRAQPNVRRRFGVVWAEARRLNVVPGRSSRAKTSSSCTCSTTAGYAKEFGATPPSTPKRGRVKAPRSAEASARNMPSI